jgi:GTPase
VEAFRSTLEEVAEANLILHVVDAADADPEAQIRAVREVFDEIDALAVPEQLVLNKIDAADPDVLQRLRALVPDALFVSARTGTGLTELRGCIEQRLPRPKVPVAVCLPFTRGDLVARVHSEGELVEESYTGSGTVLVARVNADLAAVLAPFASPVGVG